MAHEITPFPRRVPESRWWGDFRIPPSPFQPYRLRFSTCVIEVSACIPAGELPTHASSRPQAGASQTHPGIQPPSLALSLLLTPLPPPRRPGSWGSGRGGAGGGGPSETGDSLAQPWLWATRLRCRPCVCSGPRVWTSHLAGRGTVVLLLLAKSSVPVLVSPSTRECGGCQP